MLEIIDEERDLQSYSTEHLLEMLHSLQDVDLPSICYNNGDPISRICNIIKPVINESDVKRIKEFKKALIDELQARKNNN